MALVYKACTTVASNTSFLELSFWTPLEFLLTLSCVRRPVTLTPLSRALQDLGANFNVATPNLDKEWLNYGDGKLYDSSKFPKCTSWILIERLGSSRPSRERTLDQMSPFGWSEPGGMPQFELSSFTSYDI